MSTIRAHEPSFEPSLALDTFNDVAFHQQSIRHPLAENGSRQGQGEVSTVAVSSDDKKLQVGHQAYFNAMLSNTPCNF
jgi:hypothetical protein